MRRPIRVLIILLLVIGGLAAWEFPNYLRKPSLKTYVYEEVGCRIEVFFDGVRPRKVALFYRAKGMEILLDVLASDGISLAGRSFGSLRWTRDGGALVATELMEGGIETQKSIWVFDIQKQTPVSDSAKNGEIQRRGGLADPIFSWFDLGRPGRYLFTWEANRWREQVTKLMNAGGAKIN